MPEPTVEKWDLFEVALDGPQSGNPFLEVSLFARFSHGQRTLKVPGFYDGEGIYRVRFMPEVSGTWQWVTRSNVPELDGKQGRFEVTPPGPGNHGPVRVRGQYHFAYADGTPYFPFGTTCYAWTHQTSEMQSATLRTLAGTRFNKIRMGVFPKHYLFNENEPLHDVYQRTPDGALDFDRPNPAAFRHFENCVASLRDLGIVADVILFHPYDRWGYCTMSPEQDEAYLRYVTARLAAFRNVWWSLANEYDFLIDVKPMEQWDRYFQIVGECDPYRHPRSIHNGEERMNYDHRKPWVEHVCIQNWNVKMTGLWREQWGKPIVNDELEYEGDVAMPWGNLSPQELVHRFWVTVTRGGYAGHGETYMSPQDLLWWAKGGELRGESWKRIGFLRDLIEEDVKVGLAPAAPHGAWPWTRVSCGVEGAYRLIYFGEHQPGSWFEGLPEDDGEGYEVDVVDTWEMTVTPARRIPVPRWPRLRQRGGEWREATPRSAFGVQLPAKPYLALRVRSAAR